MRIINLISILLFPLLSFCQTVNFDQYLPAQSANPLPDDITVSTQEKNEEAIEKLKKKGKNKKKDKDFFLSSNFRLDEILHSGKVLFNDPIGDYVEEVFKKATTGEEDAEDVRVYIVKSSTVNAFATDQGIIVVTMGLLSQLTSEAQLAFILCHEYIHYKKQHVLDEYMQNKKIDKLKGGYNTDLGVSDKLLKKAIYSKELETEADQLGLQLYLKSGYSLDAVDQVMDILKYAYLPFEEIPFDISFLETEFLKFPKELVIDTLNEIDATEIEEEEDELSTHPNIKTRRDKLAAAVAKADSAARSEFLVSEEQFELVRKMARFELCRLNLLDRDYETALFHSYILSREDSTSEYLTTTAVKAVYGLAVYANDKHFSKVHVKEKNAQGNFHRVVHLMEELEKEELNYIALAFTYDALKKFPQNQSLQAIYDHLLQESVSRYKLDENTIPDLASWDSAVTVTDTTTVEEVVEEEGSDGNKYENIKKQKKNTDGKTTTKRKKKAVRTFVLDALVPLKRDPEFLADLEDMKKKVKEDKDDDDEQDEQHYTLGEIKRKNVEKVLLFDPIYYKIDQRKENVLKYEATLASLEKFYELIEENAKLLDIDYDLLESNDFDDDEAEKLNDIGLLYDYFYEVGNHDDLYMVATDHERIDSLKMKYEITYVALAGTVNIIEQAGLRNLFLMVMSAVVPVLWPYTIFKIAKPYHETTIFMGLHNLDTRKFEYGDVEVHNVSDSKDIMNSTLYDIMMGIKKYMITNQSSD